MKERIADCKTAILTPAVTLFAEKTSNPGPDSWFGWPRRGRRGRRRKRRCRRLRLYNTFVAVDFLLVVQLDDTGIAQQAIMALAVDMIGILHPIGFDAEHGAFAPLPAHAKEEVLSVLTDPEYCTAKDRISLRVNAAPAKLHERFGLTQPGFVRAPLAIAIDHRVSSRLASNHGRVELYRCRLGYGRR